MSLVRGTDLEGEVKSIQRQVNHDGLHSLVAHCQNEDSYRLREFCERENESSITSPFIPSTYMEGDGFFDCELNQNGMYFQHHWYPDNKGLIGVAIPPVSNGEYCAVTFSQKNNEQVTTLVTQEKYTLTTHEEQLVVPMTQAEIDANVNAGQTQTTDTFYHSELSVLDSNGYPVSYVINVEIRSSRPCRLIDNHHGYAHSISREHSVVIATNNLGRVVVSSRATDMTAPTLYARVYADDNSLSGERILLSTQGADYEWFSLNADIDANKRMADESHTTTQALRDTKLIDSSVANEQANGVAEVLRGAGQQMSTRSDTPPTSSTLTATSSAFRVNPLNQISYIAGKNSNLSANNNNASTNNTFANNPSTVFVQGSWTIDLQTGDVAQANSTSLQAMALGNIFHSIGHTFSHIVHSIAHGVKAMINGVARTITKVTMEFGDVVSAAFHYIENGIEKSIQFVMDTVEHIAKAVYAVLTQIAKFIGDVIKAVIEFIKLLLNFVDILALTRSTKHYLNQQINALPDQCQQGSKALKEFVSGETMPNSDDVDTIANQISQGSSPKPSSVRGNSSVHNYALNKLHSDLNKNTTDVGGKFGTQPQDGIAELAERSSNLGNSNDVINSLNSIMGKGFSRNTFGQLLSTGALLLDDTLNTLDDIVDDVLSQAEGTMDTLSSSLQTEVPLIGWLLKLFGIDFTMEDVVCFVIAFGAHTVYSIKYGKSLRSIHDDYSSPENLSALSDSLGVAETVMRCFCYFFMSVEPVS